MRAHLRATSDLLFATAKEAISHPSLLLPAAVLLLPTLTLQLTMPHLLRSRLAPSIWTVVFGSFAIAWLTQVATMAACAVVDRQRGGYDTAIARIAPVALTSGTLVFLGLLAGGLPGFWLQARYAFAALDTGHAGGVADRLRTSATHARPVMAPLMALAIVSMLVSLLGQSLAAGLAEASGAIVATGVHEGRTTFALSYLPHLVTSLLAFVFVVGAAGSFSIGVSVAREGLATWKTADAPVRPAGATSAAVRALLWAGGLTMALGAAAAAFKVQQHL